MRVCGARGEHVENPLQVGEPLSLVTICLDGYGLGQLRNSIASLPMVHLRAEFQHYLAQNDDQILLERADIYVIDFDQNREEEAYRVFIHKHWEVILGPEYRECHSPYEITRGGQIVNSAVGDLLLPAAMGRRSRAGLESRGGMPADASVSTR